MGCSCVVVIQNIPLVGQQGVVLEGFLLSGVGTSWDNRRAELRTAAALHLRIWP